MDRFLYYQARISWRTSQYAALALSLGMPLFLALPESTAQHPKVFIALMQTFWPMVGAFAFGPLFSQERERDTLELAVVRQTKPVKVFISTLFIGVISLLACLSTSLAAFSLRVLIPWPTILGAALPGSLLLGALGIVVAVITGNSGAAVLAPLGYWLFDVFTNGSYTGSLSLLAHTRADQITLTAIALILVLLGYILYRRHPIS